MSWAEKGGPRVHVPVTDCATLSTGQLVQGLPVGAGYALQISLFLWPSHAPGAGARACERDAQSCYFINKTHGNLFQGLIVISAHLLLR